jgi:HEAT repeat protein
VLAELVRHEDPYVRRHARLALGCTATRVSEARSYVERALGDADPAVRLTAHISLGRSVDTAVPWLVEMLASPDPDVRAAGALVLGLVRPDAREAVPALLALTRDPDARVAEEARRSVSYLDPAALAAYDREHPQAGRGGE